MSMAYSTLELEQEGPVLRVWLNRPERRNALDDTTLEEVADAFAAVRTDFGTRVVVLGGRGPAFSSGADRQAPPGRTGSLAPGAGERERRWHGQVGWRAAKAIADCEAATVCRLQGYAIGGGVVLAVACDFRLMADDAYVWVPEVDLGVPLTWGGTPRLAAEIGAARAREVIVMCDRVHGPTAERWGIAHRSVPADRLDDEVDRWVERLAAKPEAAMHMTKTQFRAYERRASLGDVTETDGDLIAIASVTDAARAAFS
jgi:enoyl-CoA hydratase/carnithine racemase